MYKLSIIIHLSNIKSFEFYKNTLLDFAKELGAVNIIDISHILDKNIDTHKLNLDQRFTIKSPKNYSELKNLFKNNDLILLLCINDSFKYFLIHYYVAKFKVKKFIISNLGYNPENFNYYKKDFIEKINIFIKFRIRYYFIRFLVLFNFWPKIDYFFESSSYVINSINNARSVKIKKRFSWINLSYYLNVIKINSKYFDDIFYSRYEVAEKYIVFIDGMIFDHKDRILREGLPTEKDRKKYYDTLYDILKKLETFYNKKIIICLHPKNEISEKQGDFKDLECVKFKTEKFISEAFIVVFHEGSSIIQAIINKKRIINLHGNILGNYVNKRCDLYAKPLSLKRFNLANYIIDDDKKLLQELDRSISNYTSYIKENIVVDETKTGIMQIIQYLNLK